MRHEDHEPREHRPEYGDGHHQHERALGLPDRQDHCHADADTGQGERIDGHAALSQATEARRRIAAAREAEHHACRNVELAVHGGKRGYQHHEIDHGRAARQADDLHDAHERALVRARGLPRHDGQHQGEREQVKNHQAPHRRTKRGDHRLLRILRLTRGNCDHLDAEIAEHRRDHGKPHAERAMREEAAAVGVVVETDAGRLRKEDYVAADHNEGEDRNDLDGRKPVLDRAEDLHVHGVDADQDRGKQQHPQPRRRSREPVLHVGGHGRDFGADRKHDAGPVGVAHQKARERIDIVFGIGTEGARRRVQRGHFREAAHQQQADCARDHIAQQHARAGEADRKAAAQEQAGADRAADRDHRQLARAEPLAQPALAFPDRIKLAHLGATERQDVATPLRRLRTEEALRHVKYRLMAPRSRVHFCSFAVDMHIDSCIENAYSP